MERTALKNIFYLFCMGITGIVLFKYTSERRVIFTNPEGIFTIVLISSILLGIVLAFLKKSL